MKWTKEKPAKEGYYWWKFRKNETPKITQVKLMCGSLVYCHDWLGKHIGLNWFNVKQSRSWWGNKPIKEPKE